MRERFKQRLLYCKACVRIKAGAFSTGAGLILAGGGVATMTGAWTIPNILGNASIILGMILILWGIRIHGLYVLQPWWRGKPSPFDVTAGVNKFDYAPGSVVAGIPWEQGFSHVYVKIRNAATDAIENVDAALAPEHPIIRSAVRCDLADCRIADAFGKPQVTVLVQYPDGTALAEPQDASAPGNYSFSPIHRLHCDKLPKGAEVHVDLATVVPELPPAEWFWKRKRTDPVGIRINIHWTEEGCTYQVQQVLELKGPEHEERS